jgi:TRAP-type C4-dicarboxylate transport system permease small subunit
MLRHLLRGFDAVLRGAALVLLVALLVVVSLGALTRSLGDPLIWTDEVARFAMIWLAVCGWLLASRRRAHIRIRYFVDKLPGTPRRATEAVLQAAVALFGALTAWFGFALVARNLDIEASTIPVSMSVMYFPVVLAGVITTVQALAELLAAARGR